MRRIIGNFKNINQSCKGNHLVTAVTKNFTSCSAKSVRPNLQAATATDWCLAKDVSRLESITVQQVRMYAPAAAATTVKISHCWHCKKDTKRKQHMICDDCGNLQDVNMEVNYFDLLDFPKRFDIEASELTQRFRRMQTLVHPDKFSNKTEREQINSAEWSSLINKAYKTLLTPIERGQYLLKMHGQQMPQDNSVLNKQFLMEMMERNEMVEDAASSEDLEQLNTQIVAELSEKTTKLSAQFDGGTLDVAKSILIEMKYLLSIQSSIKKKLQSMMGAS